MIISSKLLLQDGAALYYPIREAYIRLDVLGKTVTWYTRNDQQQLTSITYPMREF